MQQSNIKYNVGQQVYIKDIDQTATVVSIKIDCGGITYLTEYWLNGELKAACLLESYISNSKSSKPTSEPTDIVHPTETDIDKLVEGIRKLKREMSLTSNILYDPIRREFNDIDYDFVIGHYEIYHALTPDQKVVLKKFVGFLNENYK